MRRTGGAKENPIFRRSVGEVVSAAERKPIAPLEFVMPTEAHPITTFFSERARYNAATMEIRSGQMSYLLNVQASDFYSTKGKRPPNPFYFFEQDIPYPIGYRDYNGSSMSFGWTPLAYMIYYDRQDRCPPALRALWNGEHAAYTRELWCEYLRRGLLLKFDLDGIIRHLTKIVAYSDPPIEWLVDMMWEPTSDVRQNGEAMVAFEQAARDFQYRWNCGEWFDEKGVGHGSNRALRMALAI